MQQKLSSPKLLRTAKYFLINILIISLCFSILYIFDSKFKVNNVEIKGVSNSFKLLGIDEFNEQNLLMLSTDLAEKNLLQVNPFIKNIKVKKQYPDGLQIIIESYTSQALFIAAQGYFILSEDGRILSKTRDKNQLDLPEINYYQKLNYSSWSSGDFLKYKDILASLHFLKTALDLGLVIDTIDINGSNMIALHLQGKKIIFTTEKDESLEDYQLSTIIRQFKIEGRDFEVLDLRFDKPVIQFKK